jgi:hypothetical protein
MSLLTLLVVAPKRRLALPTCLAALATDFASRLLRACTPCTPKPFGIGTPKTVLRLRRFLKATPPAMPAAAAPAARAGAFAFLATVATVATAPLLRLVREDLALGAERVLAAEREDLALAGEREDLALAGEREDFELAGERELAEREPDDPPRFDVPLLFDAPLLFDVPLLFAVPLLLDVPLRRCPLRCVDFESAISPHL